MNWSNYRYIYFIISLTVIFLGLFSLLKWGINFGIDFKGGVLIEYRLEKDIPNKSVNGSYIYKVKEITAEEKERNRLSLEKESGGKVTEVRYENVGPSIGPDLIKKTIFALSISATLILFWVAYQFKSLKFGISAIIAMLHDTLVVIGFYSIFGHFWQAEADFLFVTAMLTILSFSVHDTIVVYDRIRELQKKVGGNITKLADMAVSETMVRSLNNSFTIIFMLTALVLMGGESIKWFAATLLVGTISGTYSSPFVAVPILVTWDQMEKKFRKN